MARAPHHDDEADEAALEQINVDENGRFVEQETEREAKGEKKRRAIQLERLGESLIKLKPGQLARVPLPDDLRGAVVEAQRILEKKAFGGYRRQVQLIGKIMRTVDAPPIAAALEELLLEGTLASPAQQQAEQWKKKLLEEGDAAISKLVEEHPSVDRTQLRQLVRAAKEPATQAQNQKKLLRLLLPLFAPATGALASAADVDESPGHE